MWRTGVDAERAVAVDGVLVSLESFTAATTDYGWTGDAVADWWQDTQVRLLFGD